MLSAAKVKIHGMQDDRWVIKDKISQYRGVISLYERDREIYDGDITKQKKRFSRDIKQMRKDISVKRDELVTAVYGDKQFLRNALQDHRRLQLAYMNSQAEKVVECIYQDNFNKRKLLDRINYTKKKKSDTFRQLQLESAELRDRILFDKGKLPTELKEQTVSNYVQCANIKKNAALAIKTMYTKILDILKKDSSYFTVVLEALKVDCHAQGKCLMGATEMGQLAKEYLDDHKFEYNRLEAQMKINMKERDRTLRIVRKEVQSLTDSFPNLIAKDEAANLDDLYDEFDHGSVHSVHWELEDVLATCKNLQRETLVSSFEEILPRLKAQKYQSDRLTSQLLSNSMKRDALVEDRKHRLLILDSLKNTGQENTSKYITDKKTIRDQIAAEKKEEEILTKSLDEKGKMIVAIRTALQHLSHLLSSVGAVTVRGPGSRRSEIPMAIEYALEDALQPVPTLEEDFDKLIQTSKQKTALIVNAVSRMEVNPAVKYNARNFYQGILMRTMRDNYKEEEVAEGALIEFEMDDPNVPNHDLVKLRSKQLVEAQVSEFDVPG